MTELAELNDLLGMAPERKEEVASDFAPKWPEADPAEFAPPSISNAADVSAEEALLQTLRTRNGVPIVDADELKRRIRGGGPLEELHVGRLNRAYAIVRDWCPSSEAIAAKIPDVAAVKDAAASNPRALKVIVLLLFVAAGLVYMQQAKSDATDSLEIVVSEPASTALEIPEIERSVGLRGRADAEQGSLPGTAAPSVVQSRAALDSRVVGPEELSQLRQVVIEGDRSVLEEVKALRGELAALRNHLLGKVAGSIGDAAEPASRASPRDAGVGEIHTEARPQTSGG